MMMAGPGQMGDMGMQTPLHVMTSMGPPAKVMVTLVCLGFVVRMPILQCGGSVWVRGFVVVTVIFVQGCFQAAIKKQEEKNNNKLYYQVSLLVVIHFFCC